MPADLPLAAAAGYARPPASLLLRARQRLHESRHIDVDEGIVLVGNHGFVIVARPFRVSRVYHADEPLEPWFAEGGGRFGVRTKRQQESRHRRFMKQRTVALRQRRPQELQARIA